MARLSDVDTDRVFSICFEILARGDNPTFPKVYEELGRKGSAKVVQDVISAWRRSVAEKHFAQRTRPNVPEAIVTATDKLADAIWTHAIASAQSALDAQRQELESSAAAIQSSAAAAVADARERSVVLENALREANTSKAMLEHDAASMKARLSDLEEQIRSRDETIAGQMTLMAEKDRQLKNQHAQMLDLERERKDLYSRLDAAQVDARRLDARLSESDSALKAVRELNQRYLSEIEQLRAGKASAENRSREFEGRLNDTQTTVLVLRAQAAAAEERYAALLREQEVIKESLLTQDKLEKMIAEATSAVRLSSAAISPEESESSPP